MKKPTNLTECVNRETAAAFTVYMFANPVW